MQLIAYLTAPQGHQDKKSQKEKKESWNEALPKTTGEAKGDIKPDLGLKEV